LWLVDPDVTREGEPAKNQIAISVSKIMQPNDDVGMNAQIGLPQRWCAVSQRGAVCIVAILPEGLWRPARDLENYARRSNRAFISSLSCRTISVVLRISASLRSDGHVRGDHQQPGVQLAVALATSRISTAIASALLSTIRPAPSLGPPRLCRADAIASLSLQLPQHLQLTPWLSTQHNDNLVVRMSRYRLNGELI
jgi:hypothetical protein